MRILTRDNPGRYLVEDYDVPAYYLENQVPWQDWYDTWYFSWRPPGSGRTLISRPAYKAAILRHYFKLIVLDFGDTAETDRSLTADISAAGDYHVIAELPYSSAPGRGQFTVWQYQPPKAVAVRRPAPATPAHRPHSPRRNRERQR